MNKQSLLSLTLFTACGLRVKRKSELTKNELMLLSNQSLEHIGFAQYQLMHWGKVIVDGMLHQRGMQVEEAMDWLSSEVGLTEPQAERLILEVLGQPGAAYARLAGYEKFIALRKRAKSALEGRFYLQDFHEILLKNGEVPLSVLDKLTETWIEQKLAS